MFSITTRPATPVLSARDLLREPLAPMDAWFNELFNLRPGAALANRARLEVAERDNHYEVRTELPGVDKDQISVDIDGAWVRIQAQREDRSEEREGERMLYSELSQESYARAFELPQAVDTETAQARFDNGVLSLTLPKKSGGKSTRLNIR
jgi:HSP20 family protein